MTHRFYQKTESEQKKFLWITGALLCLICIAILAVLYLSGIYLLIFLLPMAILITAPFIDLPMGKKSGKFIYYSPFFITEKEQDNRITVHGGTLFDYYFTISPDMKGRERTQFVLYGYITGLINFISEHEKEGKEKLYIRGTSYIINPRTAARFGFQPVQNDILQILTLLFNYVPITISYSFLKQKLWFPNISDIQTYEGTYSEIAAHKEELIQLKHRIKPD